MESERILEGIFIVGGSEISSSEDASSFVIDCGNELCLIDCGAGRSAKWIVENIEEAGLDPGKLSTLVLTHCHVDHIGASEFFRGNYKVRIVSHILDADAIESGDTKRTASSWYGVRLPKTTVDVKLEGSGGILEIGNRKIHWLHTPGHTPGSIVVCLTSEGRKVLFGQDIHGPFHKDFDSDIDQWRDSMQKVIELDADILCEGHFGIISPKENVRKYIQGYLDRTF